MPDPDIKIVRQAEDARYDNDGQRTAFIRIEFYVGKHGPFVERIPKADYSAAKRDELLNAFAREVRTEP